MGAGDARAYPNGTGVWFRIEGTTTDWEALNDGTAVGAVRVL